MCVLPVAMGDWIYGEWMEMEPAWERSLEVMLLGSNQVGEVPAPVPRGSSVCGLNLSPSSFYVNGVVVVQ